MDSISNKELEKRIEENKYYLLGQIQITDKEYEDLINYVLYYISLSNEFLNENTIDLKLAVGLVYIAITDYSEGNFWDKLKEKLHYDDISPFKQNVMGKIFLNTVRKYNLFELKTNSMVNQYVENIKAHSFVTQNYMEDYFWFLDDYYNHNLLRDIDYHLSDYLQDLSDYLKKILRLSNDEDISNTRVTTKSYKLLKATREVIAQCDGQLLEDLFYPSLKLLDNEFKEEILPEKNNGRFVEMFLKWIKNKEIKEDTKRVCINGKERKIYSRNPYLKFNSNSNIKDFTMVIPKRNYRASECDGQVDVIIHNGNIERNKRLEVYFNLGSFVSEEYCSYIGNDPFKNIFVEIKAIKEESFELMEEEKKYIIFNENKYSTAKLSKGINYLIIKKGINVNFSDENDIVEKNNSENWNCFVLNVNENTVCYIEKVPLSIYGEISEEPIFEFENFEIDAFSLDNQKLPLAFSHPVVSFKIEDNKINGTVLELNEERIPINSMKKQVIEMENNKLFITVDINDKIKSLSGIYKIFLNIPDEGKRFIIEYAILNNFTYRFDKSRYYDEDVAHLSIRTNILYNIMNQNYEMAKKYILNNIDYYNYFLNTNETFINILINNEFYIHIPLFKVLIGNDLSNMKYIKEKYLWYSKLNNLVYIKFPGAKKLGIYYDKNQSSVIWGNQIDSELFSINLFEFIEIITNSNNRFHYLNILYVDNKERWKKWVVVRRILEIKPYLELEYNNDDICIKIDEINGKEYARAMLKVVESKTNKTIIDKCKLQEGLNILNGLERNVGYNFYPTMIEQDEFGLNEKITTLQIRKNQGFWDYKAINKLNLSNASLTIADIVYNNEKLEKNPLIKYQIDIEKCNDNECFGTLQEIHYCYRNGNKNSIGIVEKINIGKIMAKIQLNDCEKIKYRLKIYSKIEDEWDDLFYYKKKKTLIDDDNEILDKIVYSDVIELEEEITEYISFKQY